MKESQGPVEQIRGAIYSTEIRERKKLVGHCINFLGLAIKKTYHELDGLK